MITANFHSRYILVSSMRKRSYFRYLSSSRGPAHNDDGSVLVFSGLYPQPSASAAGVRTSYMLRKLANSKGSKFKSVHFATGAKEADTTEVNDLQQNHGIMFHPSVPPNRSEAVQQVLQKIGGKVSLVLFDRFYAEEAYSFHIYNSIPKAVRVLDMQDMHSLRRGRQAIVKEWDASSSISSYDPFACLEQVMAFCPNCNDPDLLRELSSIHRSDLVLVCSLKEYELLRDFYNIPEEKLCVATFWIDPATITPAAAATTKNYEERNDFCVLGGFRHAPNVDAVEQLVAHIWPKIRARLPNASLHVYGAYAPRHIHDLQNTSDGVEIHGFVPNLSTALSDKRVLLAPLRYGAGIKGKIIDAWHHRVPVVTTPIGAEGIPIDSKSGSWGGAVESTVDGFVNAALNIYSDSELWSESVDAGQSILSNDFHESSWASVTDALHQSKKDCQMRRSRDFTSGMLWHHTARSTEYFSRWIECKETKTEGTTR